MANKMRKSGSEVDPFGISDGQESARPPWSLDGLSAALYELDFLTGVYDIDRGLMISLITTASARGMSTKAFMNTLNLLADSDCELREVSMD